MGKRKNKSNKTKQYGITINELEDFKLSLLNA